MMTGMAKIVVKRRRTRRRKLRLELANLVVVVRNHQVVMKAILIQRKVCRTNKLAPLVLVFIFVFSLKVKCQTIPILIMEEAKVEAQAAIQPQNLKKNSMMDMMRTSWGMTMIKPALLP